MTVARRARTVQLALAAAVAAILFSGPGTAYAASTHASGDATTITFYRTVVAATRAKAGMEQTETGLHYLKQDGSSISWVQAGSGAPPVGFAPVSDKIFFASANGHVKWLTDVMKPASSCKVSDDTRCYSYMVILDSAGMFDRALYSGSPVCWSKDQGYIFGYNKVGFPSGYNLYGHFQPMRQSGGTVDVTSTYTYGKQQAIEVDTISEASRLPSAGTEHLKAAPGYPAQTMSWTNSWFNRAPTEPVVTVC